MHIFIINANLQCKFVNYPITKQFLGITQSHFYSSFNLEVMNLEVLDEAAIIEMPTFSNMEEMSELNTFLLPEKPIRTIEFSGDWINEFGPQLDTVASRLVRLHFKSIGNILSLQERISEVYFS